MLDKWSGHSLLLLESLRRSLSCLLVMERMRAFTPSFFPTNDDGGEEGVGRGVALTSDGSDGDSCTEGVGMGAFFLRFSLPGEGTEVPTSLLEKTGLLPESSLSLKD